MIGMGVLAIMLAVTGPGMPSGGWQTELSGWLQHVSASMLHALSWLPGWAVIAILAVVFAVLVRRAVRAGSSPPPDSDLADLDDAVSTQEEQQ
jgi:cytochrome c-type biogenesis protein